MGFGRSTAARAMLNDPDSLANTAPCIVREGVATDSPAELPLERAAPRCSGEMLSARLELWLYRARERSRLHQLHAAYQGAMRRGAKADAAWVDVGPLAVELGRYIHA